MRQSIKYKKPSFLDNIQYIVGIILTIGLGVSLIPGYYNKMSEIIITALVVQVIISGLRAKIINVFLELVILLLSLIGFIPFLGWFFRLVAFFISLLDMAALKNNIVSKQIEIRAFKPNFRNKKKSAKKQEKETVVDAEFKEK